MDINSKIYIAGHKGLVGSALWKTLRNKGYTNLVGRSINELNLMDAVAVDKFFSEEKPEYVILAAAKVGGIVANNTYRGQFIYENLMIQNNVIHSAYVHGVKKLLFLGSTCIYPKQAPQPMPEDCLLTSPLEYTNEPYAIAKIAGIKMCESYNLQYGTNFISVMPTNLYGPNDNFDLEKSHVLPALVRKNHLGKCLQNNDWTALRADLDKNPIEGINGSHSEEEILSKLDKYGIRLMSDNSSNSRVSIEIWGTGKPMREFLWSEEMAAACVYVMENVDFKDTYGADSSRLRSMSDSATVNEVRNTHVNIGTGKEISIRHLAETIKAKVGFEGELVFNADKPDGTMRKLTDPSKIHELGWHHQIDIEEGIEKMYQWYTK
ncbi:GDP-L-fucose synthase [Carboxylicivirga sp. A043]|uniref:GDP-L-fucose synthase family protein n=1 Tax=Carboxylicivirga litoralis TaxID=2816963 RepID=UPI0021CB3A72|nr:GDP-L-fucose synthase [Carboxylicivirga sp. A043]MCU4158218.1 GDP-L-fucose synthase [Carboxylicivirga sp. A043]